MAKKSKFLRKTASQKEEKSVLEGEVGRDHSALIIPISIIKTDKNIRKKLTNIDELAESIKEHGILQALVVTKGWRLVSGHRRLEGARRAGLKEVPVRLADMDESTAAVAKLVENVQRENLDPIDEVKAVAALLPIFDGNKSALGRAIGKSPAYVSRAIKAANIVERNLCDVAKVSKSILFELADSKNPEKLIEQINKGEATTVKGARESKDRKPSGPRSGGRYVDQAIKFNENVKSGTWNLSINFAADRTPPESKRTIIKKLEELLRQLKGE